MMDIPAAVAAELTALPAELATLPVALPAIAAELLLSSSSCCRFVSACLSDQVNFFPLG